MELHCLHTGWTHLMFNGGCLTVMGMKCSLINDSLIILFIGISACKNCGELSNDTAVLVATLVKELIAGVLLHGFGSIKPLLIRLFEIKVKDSGVPNTFSLWLMVCSKSQKLCATQVECLVHPKFILKSGSHTAISRTNATWVPWH